MKTTRRHALRLLGATALAPACTGSSSPSAKPARDTLPGAETAETGGTGETGDTGVADSIDRPLTVDDFPESATCYLTASTGEGPYYYEVELDRQDITEGKDGARLQLGFRVVDPECNPIEGALVDIWHCDPTGYYAGYPTADPDEDAVFGLEPDTTETFLRGARTTDADGLAEFLTLWPGWYTTRTLHCHLKVVLAGGDLLTTQIFYDESITAVVVTTSPYDQRGPPDTTNADDLDFVPDNVLTCSEVSGGYRAVITLVVAPVPA
jgi:protocatechuate 3,4-dioxygenase beta subunit